MGPSSPSWLYGNIRQVWGAENSVAHERWVKQYGNTLQYKFFLGTFQKPEETRYLLRRIVGDGVIVAEGSKHRQQRKVMNPAFGTVQIRELTEIFVEKALELRDVWAADIKKQSQGKKIQGRLDVMTGLSRMTLDVIGLAGFNYKFNSLSGERNELSEAFRNLTNSRPGISARVILRGMLGKLGFLVPLASDEAEYKARTTMDRVGAQLMNQSKAALQKPDGEAEKRAARRDLLSLLLKANMSPDVPEHQRMTDQEVLAQVPTFLAAGHETTSTATTWALYALSLFPEIQTRLRDELFTIQSDNPTMDELNSLQYLDRVIRETLRLHAPVPGTTRVAVKDDIIPLDKPIVDRKGRVRDSVSIRKGQTVFIPILTVNRSEELWGKDALEFKPERWETPQEATSGVPGIWGNMLTFFGGPRACIGYRFSLADLLFVNYRMKALLFTLVRAFEFELAVPASEIGKKNTAVQRPYLVSDPEGGNQLPLMVRPFARVF
ncbi:hypothetical protein NP233_g4328 [Leucocoprinus birnbaumii]|uniref:Cytochrome P450 n=1 Tax=Leucocoprinus birnbaumii TaxID=56174 RepID=A0AAD5VYL5_9AGAR|nr:hypothetical protein NP233_g4328 [Leucocoprinus birnbaumii]